MQLWNSFLLAFGALLPLVNPLGSALVFLGLAGDAPPKVYRALARRIAINNIIFLAIFELLGAVILNFFGISLSIVELSGGIVIAAMGWSLLNEKDAGADSRNKLEEREVGSETETSYLEQKAFYPFTFPLTSGPGTLVVLLTLTARISHREISGDILAHLTAGTGKSSLAANFVNAACARGEVCLYFTFEESPSQILRNMGSVGLDLQPWVKKRLLHFNAMRPTNTGLEGHLAVIHRLISQLRPGVLVIDPITNLISPSGSYDVKSMLVRLVDFLKVQQITSMFTNLTFAGDPQERTAAAVSSLMDTGIVLRDSKPNGRPRRELYILKSRGMAHSREARELLVSKRGLELGIVLKDRAPATAVEGASAVAAAE